MNKKTIKNTSITMLSTIALSTVLLSPVLGNISASASATRYELKTGKSGYVYKDKRIKATKSHSAKNYFGKHKLSVKRTVTIRRHDKNLVYKWVVASNGHSGYVYEKSIKKITVKNINKFKKAKNVSEKKHKSNKLVTPWGIIDLSKNKSSNKPKKDSNNSTVRSINFEQIASQIKADFINYVNNQRRLNGKQPWVQNDALTRVAEKRVSYVDPDKGSDSHYITADGVYHAEGAPVVDAASLGYNMSSDLHESNAEAEMGYDYAAPQFFEGEFEGMITDDSASNNGHRDQLLGNKGQDGLNNVGVAVKVFRYTDRDGDDMMRAVIVILSSDKAY